MSHEGFFYGEDNFLIVARGFFDRQEVLRLRENIEHARGSVEIGDERAREAAKLGIAPDALRLSEDWYSIWGTAKLEVLHGKLPWFTHVIYPPQIRTVRNTQAFVPWHQDLAYMRALGNRNHERVVTCFTVLDDDVKDRPTLQFYVNPDQGIIEHAERPGHTFNKFDLRPADVPAPERCVTYDVGIGDALLFGRLVLHRTHAPAATFLPRTSMEFRLTTDSLLLAGKDYYDLGQRRFVHKD